MRARRRLRASCACNDKIPLQSRRAARPALDSTPLPYLKENPMSAKPKLTIDIVSDVV